jgi:hypothetical protein
MLGKKNKKKLQRPKNQIFKPPTSKYLLISLKKIFYLVFFLFILTCLILFLKSEFFSIKNFRCQENSLNYCSVKMYEFLTKYKGKNILTLSEAHFVSDLKKNFPEIEESTINRQYPSTIAISLKLKKPLLLLILIKNPTSSISTSSAELAERSQGPDNEQLLLDLNGDIVNPQGNSTELKTSLPILLMNSQKIFKENIDGREQLKFAAQLTNYLKRNISLYEIGEIVNSKLIIFLNNTQIIFSTKDSLPKQLESLQLILSRAKISGTKYQKIDLRFDKPVVVQ